MTTTADGPAIVESPRSLELEFFRMLNRIVEPRVRAGWGSPRLVPGGLVVLETRGRRTGRLARVPLAAMELHRYVIVSTFRGERSQWVKNAEADPQVRFWLRGRAREATATVLSPRRREPDLRTLPRPLRLLARFLVPYTCAGWAFAVLTPVAADHGP
jgi:deazaflavin-dependent oxidoreductase (nitroreductase family)